jgi:hypothetical protein
MKRLSDMSLDELVKRFETISLDQNEAILRDDNAKFNRLFGEMEYVENELKSRKGDQRRLLRQLYDHPNAQVRLKAAEATLAVEPEAARRQLQIIAGSVGPQAGDAGMTLDGLDDGTFKPT